MGGFKDATSCAVGLVGENLFATGQRRVVVPPQLEIVMGAQTGAMDPDGSTAMVAHHLHLDHVRFVLAAVQVRLGSVALGPIDEDREGVDRTNDTRAEEVWKMVGSIVTAVPSVLYVGHDAGQEALSDTHAP